MEKTLITFHIETTFNRADIYSGRFYSRAIQKV